MKSSASLPPASLFAPRPRCTRLALSLLAAVVVGASALAQTITSAVPGFISYQGRVTNAAGTAVGAGTPVNRKVIFRIWGHQSNSTVNDLVYSEEQTVTISEGEFSVLIGQGVAVTGTPLGYSESAKGPPTVTFNNSFSVFGGAQRFLGVTVDDGTGAADPEVSPRQQLVSSAYAMRARFAEGLGSNGNFSLAVTDQGNVGIGIANPVFPLTLPATFGDKVGLFGNFNYGLGVQLNTVQIHGAASNDDIAFGYGTSAAMTETMRIKGSGNVGIGTNNPQAKLDVNGVITVFDAGSRTYPAGMFSEAGAQLVNFGINDSRLGTNNNAAQGGFLRIDARAGENLFSFNARAAAGTSASQILSITSAGNVGIGATSPGVKLQVGGAIAADGATTGGFTFRGTGDADGGLFSPADGTLTLRTNAVERVRVDPSGNVGIGTTSVASKMHVAVGNLDGIRVESSNSGFLEVGKTGGSRWRMANSYNVDGLEILYGAAGANPGTSRLTIDTSGNVGIGTTGPATILDVRGSGASAMTVGTAAGTRGGVYLGNSGHAVVRGYPNAGDNNNVGLYTTAGDVYISANGAGTNTHLVVKNSGRVGIGTSDPIAPLQVSGGVALGAFFLGAKVWPDTTGDDNNSSFNASSAGWGGTTHSIVSDLRIRASALDVTNINNSSDARIKRIQGRSAADQDLVTLMKIEVTDYSYVDKAINGGAPQKKIIAQQVEQIFPQAVARGTDVVPDLFQKAAIEDGWIALATDLKVGERVRLIGENESGIHEVLAVEAGRFRTAFKSAGKQVFVYGREVKDFRTVDYDAVAMLNVSATQELKRQHDAEVNALRAANASLEQRLAELEARDRARDAKLASIEKLLSSGQTVMARPATSNSNHTGGQE